MADILSLVFRTFMSQSDLKKDVKVITPSPTTCSTLVVGDHSLSRSVLLLASVTAAAEMGIKVMFFTQTQIQSLPPSLQRCVPNLSPESLKVGVVLCLNCAQIRKSLFFFTTRDKQHFSSPGALCVSVLRVVVMEVFSSSNIGACILFNYLVI